MMSSEYVDPTLAPAAPPPPAADSTPPKPPTYFISRVKDREYACTLNVGVLTPANPDYASVYLWLSTLTENDTVRFHFRSSITPSPEQFALFLPLINPIILCSARTIGVIDRMFSGIDAYFVFACKEVEITEFALMQLPSYYPPDAARASERDEAVAVALNALVANAVENLKILTANDAEDLFRRKTAVVTGEELFTRCTSDNTTTS